MVVAPGPVTRASWGMPGLALLRRGRPLPCGWKDRWRIRAVGVGVMQTPPNLLLRKTLVQRLERPCPRGTSSACLGLPTAPSGRLHGSPEARRGLRQEAASGRAGLGRVPGSRRPAGRPVSTSVSTTQRPRRPQPGQWPGLDPAAPAFPLCRINSCEGSGHGGPQTHQQHARGAAGRIGPPGLRPAEVTAPESPPGRWRHTSSCRHIWTADVPTGMEPGDGACSPTAEGPGWVSALRGGEARGPGSEARASPPRRSRQHPVPSQPLPGQRTHQVRGGPGREGPSTTVLSNGGEWTDRVPAPGHPPDTLHTERLCSAACRVPPVL